MKKKSQNKPLIMRILAIFLSVFMVVSVLPVDAIAAPVISNPIVKFAITDQQKNPIKDVQVDLREVEDGNVIDTSVSDEKGEAIFKNLDSKKTYYYQANLINYEMVQGSIVVNADKDTEVQVTLKEVPVNKGATAKFIITNQKKEPMPKVRIDLREVEDGEIIANAVSNEKGEVIFENLDPAKVYFYNTDILGYEMVQGSVKLNVDQVTEVPLSLCAKQPTAVIKNNLQEKMVGENVSFVVEANGQGNLSFQWFHNDSKLENTSTTLNIENITIADSGKYFCEVSSDLSKTPVKVEADLAVKKMEPMINITSDTVSESLYTGNEITFTVSVTGTNEIEQKFGKPTGSITFKMDNVVSQDIVLENGQATYKTVLSSEPLPHILEVTYNNIMDGKEDQTYLSSNINMEYVVNKIHPKRDNHYTVSASNNKNGWYNAETTFDITPIGLFDEISMDQQEWLDKIVKEDQTNGMQVSFWLRNKNTGEVSYEAGEIYKRDANPPTNIKSEKVYNGFFWKKEYIGNKPASIKDFTNSDNYNYFVKVSAEDDRSGIDFFQWKYCDEKLWSNPVKPKKDGNDVVIQVNKNKFKKGIDIFVCDNAGNTQELVASGLPEKILNVTYDQKNLQAYLNQKNEDIKDEDIKDEESIKQGLGVLKFIYDEKTKVTFDVPANTFKPDDNNIKILQNGNEIPVEWILNEKENKYVGTIDLKEGESVFDIDAPGYEIYTNEIETEVFNEKYTSAKHVVDTINPVIHIDYNLEDFDKKDQQRIIITVDEQNFRKDKIKFSEFSIVNIDGKEISGFDIEKYNNMLSNAEWTSNGTEHTTELTFKEEGNYKITVDALDLAGRKAEKVSKTFYIDRTAPENLKIAYKTTPINMFLDVISFGYYNPSVTIKLFADDMVSGVDHFNWEYKKQEGSSESIKKEESGEITYTDTEHFAVSKDKKTSIATFDMKADEFTQYRGSFSFSATDKTRYESYKQLGNGKMIDVDGNEVDTGDNHIVVIDTIKPERVVEYPEPVCIRDKNTFEIYQGDKKSFVNQENTNSIIYYDGSIGEAVPVTLKITEANFYAEDVFITVNGNEYIVDEWAQNGDEWTGIIYLREDGNYSITAKYMDKSGNFMNEYKSEMIFIDRVAPVVERYELVPETVDGKKDVTDFIESLQYGYYFKEAFKVIVYTSDAEPSSGNDLLTYTLLPYQNGEQKDAVSNIIPIVNGMAEFSIPEGFKGQIYVNSTDRTGNKSKVVVPQAFVVDNEVPVVEIKNNNDTSLTDELGNKLYVDDMSFTVTIEDSISGIKEIGYQQNSENASTERFVIPVEQKGYSVGDDLGDGWMVTTIDQNLVTAVTKVFAYGGDDNNLNITVDAMDNSMNAANAVTSDTVTIDKTAPIINVTFREDDDTDIYYNANRVADIVVTERNFSSELIEVMIDNSYGNVPGHEFTKVSDSEYTAVIDFDEGDYLFDVNGTDMGNHAATVNYAGGNERTFSVDKTAPSISENFNEFTKTETNNSFNVDKNIEISIVEHNFDPSLAGLRILRKESGSEHSEEGLVDVSGEISGSSSWSSNEDTHTLSFKIQDDAVYRVEIMPTDLADNKTDLRSTLVFEVDKTVPVISARNGETVNPDENEFMDIYTYERKDEPAPTLEFDDINIAYIKYDLLVWRADYSNPDSLPVVVPIKVYLENDPEHKGVITDKKIVIPDFAKDGVYTIQLVAVDTAGNESAVNTNTYARMVEQDVLAYILNSSPKNKTGLYSFQYENGDPMSMRPDNFSDLKIFVLAKQGSDVKIVLRDTNSQEIPVTVEVTKDERVYGFTAYNFDVSADFFKDTFSDDMDADLHLAVNNDGKRIDLGRIHIDNVEPTYKTPKEFSSWHWFIGNEPRKIVISDISELLDEKQCKVYDNGEEIQFVYSEEESTITFVLEKGWHNIGAVLSDMAGNEIVISEQTNIHVGYFWAWIIAISIIGVTGIIIGVVIMRRRRRQKLEAEL